MSALTPKQEPEREPNPWATYEQRKAELPEDLTFDEWEAACKRIAEELGI